MALQHSNELMLSRQGHRLLQIGIGLLLLTSFEGFVIPAFAAPRLGLSAHSLMALLGVLLIAMGLVMAKTASWNRSHAAGVLVFDLFEHCDCGCLLAGRSFGGRQLHNAISSKNCSRKRPSGDDHQNHRVLIRTDGH